MGRSIVQPGASAGVRAVPEPSFAEEALSKRASLPPPAMDGKQLRMMRAYGAGHYPTALAPPRRPPGPRPGAPAHPSRRVGVHHAALGPQPAGRADRKKGVPHWGQQPEEAHIQVRPGRRMDVQEVRMLPTAVGGEGGRRGQPALHAARSASQRALSLRY